MFFRINNHSLVLLCTLTISALLGLPSLAEGPSRQPASTTSEVQARDQSQCFWTCLESASGLPLWNAGQSGEVYECLYGTSSTNKLECYYDYATGQALAHPVSAHGCPTNAEGPTCGKAINAAFSFLQVETPQSN